MYRYLGILIASLLLIPGSYASEPLLEIERSGGTSRLWVESAGKRQLLRESDSELTLLDAGEDPTGRAIFANWDEEGEIWSAHSRDGGASWAPSRILHRELRLVDGTTLPGSAIPQPPSEYMQRADGRLRIVQFKTTSLPEWRQALTEAGAEILSYLPHNAHIVRVDPGSLATIASLEFVERVEPYHPWYRLEPALRQSTHQERVRVVTFEWGPSAKERVIEAAETLGAEMAEYWPSGQILELWADPDQLRALAGHDDVLWIDRWSEPEHDMDIVRQDSGADWLEDSFGFCGQGVRGEVMDLGIQADHPDFDGVLLHGPYGLDSHGTATYGIVFGNGDRDGDGDGKAIGHLPCDGAQGIFADNGEFTDRFVHTQELKSAPYYASFQTNSWGSSATTTYTSYSSEMDDIIWRLDIAITQSQSNNGNRSSRPQAWAKNVISVGGVYHYGTLDTSDDAWNNGASIGPAADDRVKPDVSYWYDQIYTTSTGSSYTSAFGGTSAATPETAGVVGLIVQMWADNVWESDPQGATVFDKQPHASTIKALLINNAEQYDFTGTLHDLTRVHQGWGRPSARTAYERAVKSLVVDEEEALQLDDFVLYDIAVEPGESELKVTMVYPDPPGTTSSTLHRINDLNLEATSPSATVYHGNVGLDVGTESTPGGSANGIDTVENVFIRNPEAGIWTVKVEAVEINQDGYLATPEDDATFALVVTGGTGLYTASEGEVHFLKSEGACDETFPIRVRDGNAGSSTVTVDVWSGSESVPETVVLQETVSGSGNYSGEIPTTNGAVLPGNGILTALHGESITVEYDDGGVPRQDSATIDCQGPVISQIASTGITDTAATITWTTDEEADSRVNWDSAVPPLGTEMRAGRDISHTVNLRDLNECTTYYYSVGSEDPVGNLSEEDNGGGYFYFVTLKRTDGQLHSCRAGRLVLDAARVSCSGSVPVRLTDLDLNLDPGSADSAIVYLSSSTETEPELLLLVETGPDTSTFTGSIPTGPGPAVGNDGILQATDGDLITGRHNDADDGSGATNASLDTIVADCAGPEIADVAVSNITVDSATISWSTSELTTGHVDWGTTAALGNQVTRTFLSNSHSVDIGPFPECGRIYFRIVAEDALDNGSVADDGGIPFEFNAAMVPGLFFADDFESNSGWTLEGEWEIGTPQALGSSPGDPVSAYSGTGVLGHDLSGLGSLPGDFEPNTTENAISPVIDASSFTNAELTFRRRLNVAPGSIAYLHVYDGGSWLSIWQSPVPAGLTESAWSAQSYDVSQYADGNSNFQIRFRQASFIAQGHDAGWNVDLLTLRDGNLPSIGVCGGCGGLPLFGGLLAAEDDDPCADSGLTLSWQAAPAWGTGSGGSYAIYRDTSPGFAPGPGNLLVSGITATTWNDPSPPADVTLYYLVRAENDETCGSGPNNSGLTDGNLAYVVTENSSSQLPPGDVGDTLRVDPVNYAHARLSWSALPAAATYRIYRSAMPETVVDLEAESGEILFEDADVFADGQNWYYLIKAMDTCGNEGP
jgi:serine protease AprX